MNAKVFLLTSLSACLTGCGSPDPAQEAIDAGRSLSSVDEWQRILESSGVVVFRSWNGKAIRMDGDTELVFFADGRIGMLEYGFAGISYPGSYEVRADGSIAARFEGFPEPWPEMVLDIEGDDLLLWPRTPETGAVLGNRGAMYVPEGSGSYWPFRQLQDEEAAAVVDTWYEWTGATQQAAVVPMVSIEVAER